MQRAEFWKLMEESNQASGGDPDLQADLLQSWLAEYPPEEILSFDKILLELMDESYTNELWAAAYILNGGCSDDCFDYFRGWLIAQGAHAYNEALRDPETLASVATPDDWEFEDMLGVAMAAYEGRTGQPYPGVERPAWQLKGEDWDEDTVEQKYPKLAAAVRYID